MRFTIDDTYREVLPSLPAELRGVARELPYHLGLVKRPDQGWEEFVQMDANRDLPRYAAEDPLRPGNIRLPRESLAAYLRAHHLGAVYGLISDRLVDGQVKNTATLGRLRQEVFGRWTGALATATGSKRRATALTSGALRALEWGTEREKRALARARRKSGTLSPREYVRLSCAKLRWFGAASHGLLLAQGEPRRARALREAYDTFSMGLQCVDDALDEAADRAERGASFPSALGFPAEGLLAAAPGLFARAARLAAAARFHELGAWLGHLASFTSAPVPGCATDNAIVALVLHTAAREASR